MELDDIGNRVLAYGFDRWHSRTGLAVVLGGTTLLGIAILAGIDISNVSRAEWGILGLVLIGIGAAWFKTRIERNPRGRVGFGVAIYFESSEQARTLGSDFVITLKNLLNRSQHTHRFNFIEYPQSIAKRLQDQEEAGWLSRKARLHFLIYGRARLRRIAPGEESHVLDLSWVVRHSPISTERSVQFANETKSIFPNRLILGNAGDMTVSEFGAHLIDAVARYIIGTAAALSNDFTYAEELLCDSEAKLAEYAKKTEGAPIAVLLSQVRKRICELYGAWMAGLAQQYAVSRDREALKRNEEIVNKLRRYEPDNYAARLTAAMAAFVLRRDVASAMQELAACHATQDGTWMYSEAFLLAYDGDLENSYRCYRRAFESPISDGTVPMQCEEFIQRVIDDESGRPWLYFCLGLINHRAKRDLRAARNDFARFVESVDATRFRRHIEIVNEWIHEIDARLAPQS
jgi:hypothetical protein